MKKALLIGLTTTLITCVLTAVNLFSTLLAYGNGAQSSTSMRICVSDASGNPLARAAVYVLEKNSYYYTDLEGYTPVIELAFTSKEAWQGVTVFIYREGYVDSVVYGLVIHKHRHREGPRIRMFADDGSMPKATVYSENPPDEYTYKLLEAYRPKG